MSTWFISSVILFVSILACRSLAVLYKDDKCSLKDGSQGICKLIKECPTAVQLITTGIIPVICGFEKTESIVCCKDGEEAANPTSTTTTSNPVISRTPGDISRQKCKEYAEHAYEKIPAPTLLLNPHFTKKLVCDIPGNRLIVGTNPATRREFPHMAVIGFKYEGEDEVHWLCEGSLISENFVLTAGHCSHSRVAGPPKVVRFGIVNKTDPTNMQERTVSQVFPHPNFTKYHDIGLVKLSENVNFNTYVRPACLHPHRYLPYDLAIASTWGSVDYRGERLLQVVFQLLSATNCNASYEKIISNGKRLKYGIIDDLMICGVNTKNAQVICQGHSGGPLQVYHEEIEEIKCMYDIIGVIAFGKSCGLTKDNPIVHMRVSNYIKWIEDIVWPN